MKPSRFILFIIVIMGVIPIYSLGKDVSFVDVDRMNDDSNKVESLIIIATNYIEAGSDSGKICAEMALKMAVKLNYNKGIGRSHSVLGAYYYSIGNFSESIVHLNKALLISIRINDWNFVGSNYRRLGNWHVEQQLYNDAMAFYLRSDSVYEIHNSPERYYTSYQMAIAYESNGEYILAKKYALMAEKFAVFTNDSLGNLQSVYNLLGIICADNIEAELSIYYYSKALKYTEQLGSDQLKANVLVNIGNVYESQKRYDKATEYLMEAKNIIESNQDTLFLISTYGALSELLSSQEKYNEAIIYLSKGLQLSVEKKLKDFEARVLGSMADIFIKMKKYNEALECLKRSEEIYTALNSKSFLAKIYNSYGEYYFKLDQYKVATEYDLKALKIYQDLKQYENIVEVTGGLSEIYERAGDYQSSNKYLRYSNSLKDSLQEIVDKKKFLEQQTLLDVYKKETQIRSLKQNEEIQVARISKQRSYIWSLVLIVLIAAVSAFLLLKANNDKRKANLLLAKQTEETMHQKNIVEEKNKSITDSINYARRIQHALLPSELFLKKSMPDYFILYKPKDIVSGDFYWAMNAVNKQNSNDKSIRDVFLLATADCTGHGVPGAFMSMIGITYLNEIVVEKGISAPDKVMNELRHRIIQALNQDGVSEEGKDGMDMVLCSFDFKNMILEYSAAYNPFYIIRDNSLITNAADKFPIGKQSDEHKPFTLQTVKLNKGDMIYTFTDGYADQFGGPKGKKFKYKSLQDTLLAIHNLSMDEQKKILDSTIESWRGNLEQVDDILIIGVRA